MIFKARLDKTATIITALVSILFVIILIYKFNFSLLTILLITYLFCLYLKPLRYEIQDDQLIIKRLIKSVYIKKSDIESLKLIDKHLLNGSLRTFGVGGLFGWYGKFTNQVIGDMTWYLTRRDKPILITTKVGKKILISPEEAERFVEMYSHQRQ